MLRRSLCLLQQQQQPELNIYSAYSLLRMCHRSIDIRVRSRHGKAFLKRRLIDSWRKERGQTNPERQRFLIERAGALLQMLHMEGKAEDGPKAVRFQLSRVVAAQEKEAERTAGISQGNVAKTKSKLRD